jgi:hypothetical protein
MIGLAIAGVAILGCPDFVPQQGDTEPAATVILRVHADDWATVRKLVGAPAAGPVPDALRPELRMSPLLSSVPTRTARLDDDGTCRLDSVAAGIWTTAVQCSFRQGVGARSVTSRSLRVEPGGKHDITLRLRELPAGVDGRLVLDGKPAADVTLMCELPIRDPFKARRTELDTVKTDNEGRFHLLGDPGSWSIRAVAARADGGAGMVVVLWVRALRAGELLQGEFKIATRSVRLRLLDADGQPLPRAQIQLRDASGRHRELLVTDETGRVAIGCIEDVPLRAFTWRRQLQDEAARQRLLRERPGTQFGDMLHDLGTLPVDVAGEEIVLKLPAR